MGYLQLALLSTFRVELISPSVRFILKEFEKEIDRYICVDDQSIDRCMYNVFDLSYVTLHD